MEKTKEKKVTLVIPSHHQWTKGIWGLNLLVEALLDKNFEGEFSENPEENENIAARNIIKAQKLIDGVRKRREEEKRIGKAFLARNQNLRQKFTEPDD